MGLAELNPEERQKIHSEINQLIQQRFNRAQPVILAPVIRAGRSIMVR